MPSIVAAAQALADAIEAVPATHDPDVASNNLPCVLVGPPRIDYQARTNTWPLYCLASHPHGSLAAVDELDELLQAVVAQLDVERAEPATYRLRPDSPPIPAYVVYVTT